MSPKSTKPGWDFPYILSYHVIQGGDSGNHNERVAFEHKLQLSSLVPVPAGSYSETRLSLYIDGSQA